MRSLRSLAAGTVLFTVTAAAVAIAPAASAAPVTTGASAYAAPAATGSATLAAQLNLTGAVGGLLNGIVGPIVSSALNPLVAALQGSVNGLVGSALGASSSYNAGSPNQQSDAVPGAFPGDLPGGLPAPCDAGSVSLPCFHGASTSLNAAPLASVGVSTLAGYTEQVRTAGDAANPVFGRAQVGSPTVAVLPAIPSLVNPIVSAGVVDAKANCPNAGSTSPTASVSATNVSVLGGLIGLSVLNGAIAGLRVNGTTYASLTDLPVLNIGNLVVQRFGSSVRVDIPLTLDQLVAGLGLPTAAITELLNDATSASLKLSVIVGPNSARTATTAKAWGLGIAVDLSGSATFDLLGLVGATVAVPSGIGGGNYGNVLDLRLGYVTCRSGSSTTDGGTPAIPPALV